MRIVVEYTRDELRGCLVTETHEALREIVKLALHESLAEWRQQNLATTDPTDLPIAERAVVRVMMEAEIVLREERRSDPEQEIRDDVDTLGQGVTAQQGAVLADAIYANLDKLVTP